jgi:hypothetical protein
MMMILLLFLQKQNLVIQYWRMKRLSETMCSNCQWKQAGTDSQIVLAGLRASAIRLEAYPSRFRSSVSMVTHLHQCLG